MGLASAVAGERTPYTTVARTSSVFLIEASEWPLFASPVPMSYPRGARENHAIANSTPRRVMHGSSPLPGRRPEENKCPGSEAGPGRHDPKRATLASLHP